MKYGIRSIENNENMLYFRKKVNFYTEQNMSIYTQQGCI